MPKNNSKPERERRRREAEERQERYATLTLDEKQIGAITRPGNAFRERSRLMKLVYDREASTNPRDKEVKTDRGRQHRRPASGMPRVKEARLKRRKVREILELADEGLLAEEITEAVGTPLGTVRNILEKTRGWDRV